MNEFPHTKRLMERWEADESFRELMELDPVAAVQAYRLQSDAESLRPLWDSSVGSALPVSAAVEAYRAWIREAPAAPRATLELGEVAYFEAWAELCRLWLEEVGTRVELCGLSEPFDNPDYERFAAQFAQVCGGFPLTTTAVPLRDPARTRRLLQSGSRHRFVVRTLDTLNAIHREFSAEELRNVELVSQPPACVCPIDLSRPEARMAAGFRQALRDLGLLEEVAC